MLKILRKGEKTLPEDKIYKMKCGVCGCEYVYHLNKTYTALGKGNANSDEVYICNYLEGKWEDLD